MREWGRVERRREFSDQEGNQISAEWWHAMEWHCKDMKNNCFFQYLFLESFWKQLAKSNTLWQFLTSQYYCVGHMASMRSLRPWWVPWKWCVSISVPPSHLVHVSLSLEKMMTTYFISSLPHRSCSFRAAAAAASVGYPIIHSGTAWLVCGCSAYQIMWQVWAHILRGCTENYAQWNARHSLEHMSAWSTKR